MHKHEPHHDHDANKNGKGIFYCPMHCEGEKTYDKPGNCPVCGMHLIEQPQQNIGQQ
jgi:Cu2+-exporting ATPase